MIRMWTDFQHQYHNKKERFYHINNTVGSSRGQPGNWLSNNVVTVTVINCDKSSIMLLSDLFKTIRKKVFL